MKYPHSECFLNAYSLITNMLFPPSSHSSSSLSSSSSTSLLRSHRVVPTLLSNYTVHLLYTGILANPIALHSVEDLPLYDEDLICQELICLFHLVASTQWYHALSAPSDLPVPFGIPLSTFLNTLPGRILNILHLHGFHTFVKRIPSEVLYPMFRQVFLSMTIEERNHYLERTKLPTAISPPPVPIPPHQKPYPLHPHSYLDSLLPLLPLAFPPLPP